MGFYMPKIRDLVGEWLPFLLGVLPDLERFRTGLILVTLLALALTFAATNGELTPLKVSLSVAIAAVMFLNVFVPHVPAALLLGGYSPGVATAVLVNLPVSVYFLRRSAREGYLRSGEFAGLAAAALGVLLIGLPLLFLFLR